MIQGWEIQLTCSFEIDAPFTDSFRFYSKSLEFNPKLKEIVSCRYRGSSSCFLLRLLHFRYTLIQACCTIQM